MFVIFNYGIQPFIINKCIYTNGEKSEKCSPKMRVFEKNYVTFFSIDEVRSYILF